MTSESATIFDQIPLVLIANDQEWTARAVESILVANGYRVQRVFTARETLEQARVIQPDILILDQQLPDFSGVEVCRRLRNDPAFGATLPVIITTAGPSGRDLRYAAYEAGAWDFFGQPLDAETILRKLSVYLAASREVKQMRRELLVDSPSGLYSRAGLTRRAGELLAEAERTDRVVSCVVWEIDAESPELGEMAGKLFRKGSRSGDTVGRLATNRFATLAPGTETTGAVCLADRLRHELATLTDGDVSLVRSQVLTFTQTDQFSLQGGDLLDQLDRLIAA